MSTSDLSCSSKNTQGKRKRNDLDNGKTSTTVINRNSTYNLPPYLSCFASVITNMSRDVENRSCVDRLVVAHDDTDTRPSVGGTIARLALAPFGPCELLKDEATLIGTLELHADVLRAA